MVTPGARRKAVAHLRDTHQVSERRACSVIDADRSMVRYRCRRPADEDLRRRLRELSAERRRFGYRRLHILLLREGWMINHKKLRRLYREECLQVRKRGGRKRALGTRAPMLLPDRPNRRWSLDFLSDAFSDGRRFRIRERAQQRGLKWPGATQRIPGTTPGRTQPDSSQRKSQGGSPPTLKKKGKGGH